MDPTVEPTFVHVLIEHPGSLRRLELTEELGAAGYEVATCPGPRAALPRSCPLLGDERCPLVNAADVIINGLHAEQEAVLERQRQVAPDTPVILLVGADASAAPVRSTGSVVTVGGMLAGADLITVLDHLGACRERHSAEQPAGLDDDAASTGELNRRSNCTPFAQLI